MTAAVTLHNMRRHAGVFVSPAAQDVGTRQARAVRVFRTLRHFVRRRSSKSEIYFNPIVRFPPSTGISYVLFRFRSVDSVPHTPRRRHQMAVSFVPQRRGRGAHVGLASPTA
jgi:hypothetical protein